MILEVALEKVTVSMDKLYAYSVPFCLKDHVFVGMRIKVPFGKYNKTRNAFVVRILNDEDFLNEKKIKLKEIDSFLDDIPLINDRLVDFACWMSEHYFCNLYECLSLFVPKYVKNYWPLQAESLEMQKNDIHLSDYQNYQYIKILDWFRNSKVKEALLYGITGSGKTKVFLKLVQEAAIAGEKIIILVPEISLIPQMSANIEEIFGKNSFACLHSGLSDKVRFSEWSRIKSGSVNIVLGTRSAIFAPLIPDLIIIDEEQEATYKSDKSPRFNAKEIAQHYCKEYGSKLLLSSATPSIDSFYFAKKNKKILFELKKRYGQFGLPEVKIVNISKSLYNIKSILSVELIESLFKTVESNKQAILLLDRRGYHNLARCLSCGTSIMCKNCNTTLNHHVIEGKNILICHYCGYQKCLPKKCENCGSKIILIGVGTQSLEQEIMEIIPGSRCIRVDADTTKSKKSYEKMFKDFKDGKYNIMIGTRMVAKGLDFKNVNLVGILCADQSLFGEGYKTYERTFSLISQTIGRAGRHDNPGKAIIQTFSSDNQIIDISSRQDYDYFFEREIAIRKLMIYPPFADICTIGFVGKKEKETWESCLFFFESLKYTAASEFRDIPLKILSPTTAFLTKLSNKFRFKINIKCKNNSKFRQFIRKSMLNYENNELINGIKILKSCKSNTNIFVDTNSEHYF